MPRLALASNEQIESIYRESHAVWGAGLELQDYIDLWTEVSDFPWVLSHAGFHVWLDDENRVLSSMKVYRPLIRIGETVARAAVLGAIYTPMTRRRRGYAGAMLGAVIRRCREEGHRACLLFSDIGTAYYARFGFVPLPAEEQWGRIPNPRRGAADGWELREMRDEDLDDARRMHDEAGLSRPLAVVRDAAHWDFLHSRTRSFFARLQDREIQSHTRVVTREGELAGYVVSIEGRGEWNVREVESATGAPDLLETVFRVAAGQARRDGLRRFYGWLPRDLVDRLPDWKMRCQSRRRAVPMLLPLDRTIDLGPFRDPQSFFVPYQDQF